MTTVTPRRARPPRATLAVVAAALAAILAPLLGTLGGSPFRAPIADAASTGLTMTADTRYVVDPAKHRVHVSATLVATNHRTNTKTHLFYFDRAYLAVQPGTTGFK